MVKGKNKTEVIGFRLEPDKKALLKKLDINVKELVEKEIKYQTCLKESIIIKTTKLNEKRIKLSDEVEALEIQITEAINQLDKNNINKLDKELLKLIEYTIEKSSKDNISYVDFINNHDEYLKVNLHKLDITKSDFIDIVKNYFINFKTK